MLPIGPLMIEHRLIERMIKILNMKLISISETNILNVSLIDTAVDFIKTYADRCHHGKEEDILFRELKKKKITNEHKKIMDELIKEHIWGREATKRLVLAKENYLNGSKDSINEIIGIMKELIEFYPVHIEKEDKHFFIPIMEYFSKEEKDNMLQESWEFDRKLIHEKYKTIVDNLE
ncbi:MAG: cation-binding protein [Elusimicrobia bacterium RIFOXYD2_FULL_34_15]|nr:MAG: cation-binding protein [Elusimicrobia bacterium RIFOXYD2_FULL_34_15]